MSRSNYFSGECTRSFARKVLCGPNTLPPQRVPFTVNPLSTSRRTRARGIVSILRARAKVARSTHNTHTHTRTVPLLHGRAHLAPTSAASLRFSTHAVQSTKTRAHPVLRTANDRRVALSRPFRQTCIRARRSLSRKTRVTTASWLATRCTGILFGGGSYWSLLPLAAFSYRCASRCASGFNSTPHFLWGDRSLLSSAIRWNRHVTKSIARHFLIGFAHRHTQHDGNRNQSMKIPLQSSSGS